MYYRNTQSFHSVRRNWQNAVKAPVTPTYTKEQVALQTFLANGLVAARSVDFAKSVAHAARPSSKQLFWVQKMLDDVMNIGSQNVAPVAKGFDVSKIFTLFDNAAKNKLRFPKIKLTTDEMRPLRLNTSRNHPGFIFLGSGGFGTDSYGKLSSDGNIRWYTKDVAVQQDVEAMVKAFAVDPVKVAADYGKLNHHCCFCSKPLDDQQSLDVGYGPVCARKFDLPWGKRDHAERTKPNVKELVNGLQVLGVATALKLDADMNDLLSDSMD